MAEAEATLKNLKCCLICAPVLIQPDPALWFIVVQVDDSDMGVGAVIAQQSFLMTINSIHVLLFLHKLSPPGRTHDVGNWELLAIQMALEQ